MVDVVLKKVGRHYGSVKAVDDIDLTVKSGKFATLLGSSGCGKTTTLRMVSGLERNTTGQIYIGDSVVSDAARGLFVPPEARNLGMVFQSYAVWPHMTVFDNIAYPLKIRRLPKSQIREKVMSVLDLVEMAHLANRPAPDLSGGQQQRVAIARALVFEPRGLLLDEPLSNLDARLRIQMGEEFRSIQQRLGITTIYVTHDQTEAMALSDDVVLMSGGTILQNASPREIYLHPKTRDVAGFFGTPNFVAASVKTVTDRSDGLYEVKIDGMGASSHCLSAFRPAAGQNITVMLRPESMRIAEDREQPTGMLWSGKVRKVIFRGPIQSVTVDTGDTCLNVEAAPLQALAMGQKVLVVAPSNAAWVLPN